MMSAYEARRLENIKRNQALIEELGIQRTKQPSIATKAPSKKRKLSPSSTRPTRTSARIASATEQPSYNEDDKSFNRSLAQSKSTSRTRIKTETVEVPTSIKAPPADLDTIRAGWTSWKPSAPPPTRDVHGTFHFPSHPIFQPNKSPAEMLSEGVFGGSYYRPLYSRTLATTIKDDWTELPAPWTSNLNTINYLTNSEYNPEINKYGVKCGQSIEEWEASGWIAHEFDIRGWFQWYTRFWMGRRCEDDSRQVGRWNRCVGERGRWRRTLLKRYLQAGVRSVADEGGDEAEVSPVLHQTCLHWGFEIRQEILDEVWRNGL